jgi:hypothetical protein
MSKSNKTTIIIVIVLCVICVCVITGLGLYYGGYLNSILGISEESGEATTTEATATAPATAPATTAPATTAPATTAPATTAPATTAPAPASRDGEVLITLRGETGLERYDIIADGVRKTGQQLTRVDQEHYYKFDRKVEKLVIHFADGGHVPEGDKNLLVTSIKINGVNTDVRDQINLTRPHDIDITRQNRIKNEGLYAWDGYYAMGYTTTQQVLNSMNTVEGFCDIGYSLV